MNEVQDVKKEEENPLADLVKSSLDQDYNKANEIFNDVMTVKLTDVLDQAKVKLAGQIYNGDPEDEEIEDEDLEVEDEESGDDDESIDDEDAEYEDETDESDIEETEVEGDDDGTEPDEDEDEVEGAAV